MSNFISFKLFEDVAVGGEVSGQGDFTFPQGNSNGSGDSFSLGIPYNKYHLIQKILKKTNFKIIDLYNKNFEELKKIDQEYENI